MTSPVVLGALVVLLLNDHVLKRAWPGLVTGKLSDLAGPVVAAALLGCLARLVSRRLEAAAWVAVAVAFALCKTVPAVNAAVPIAGVTDPWDLVGLAALPLAWRTRHWRPAAWRPALPLRAAAVVVAVLAVSATSSETTMAVERIDGSGGAVRAVVYDSHRERIVVWASGDGGLTWRESDDTATLAAPRTSTCSARHCYRIVAEYDVEESTDGGATWRPSWSGTYRELPYAARDVTFVAGTDVVLVATGRGGVLRRDGAGPWREVAVGKARPPTPAPARYSFSTGA